VFKNLKNWIVPVEVWFAALIASAVMIGVYDWLHPTSIARDNMIQQARESSVKIEYVGVGHASGVVIADKGRIITNAHVCRNRDKLGVKLWDDRLVLAEIVWVAKIEKYDLCLIDAQDWSFVEDELNTKVLQDKDFVPPEDAKKQTMSWTPVEFADKDPKVGQSVMHIGNMLSIRELISFGTIGRATTGWNDQEAYAYVGKAGPGSSGGGVFNLDGDLLGIIYSGHQIVVGGRFFGGTTIPLGVGHIIPYHIVEYALAR
jgi:S1-C subfamily serine protease